MEDRRMVTGVEAGRDVVGERMRNTYQKPTLTFHGRIEARLLSSEPPPPPSDGNDVGIRIGRRRRFRIL